MPTLEFKGKQFVYSHHHGVPFRELQVVQDKSLPDEGKKPSLDDNLIIHGDNLEALKALLPTHAGKVDCIFIDPPYNTGNEGWCYNDNVRSPLMKEWLKKSANPVDKEDLERHDKWLCMMWPRLNLLKELLAEDGSIWVTLDDNEAQRAKLILDEIFGEEAFVASIAWQARYSVSNDASVSTSHNYILVYSKAPETWKKLRNEIPRDEKQEKQYSNPDDDPEGPWRAIPWDAPNIRENLSYPITTLKGSVKYPPKGRCWAREEEKWNEIVEKGLAYFGKNGDGAPSYKRYLKDAGTVVPTTWWPHDSSGHTDEASKELSAFGLDTPFATPKPVRLLERILRIATHEDSLVLDSFSGSGTTAEAIISLNKKDGGNRRFILVECEDYADTLTAERVRRVINGYPYTGTQREELHRENITWSTFGNSKKHKKVMDQVESIENLHGHEYDKIKKQIKDGVLTVTGERKVEKTAPGLGGSFTYCTLGEPIDIESLLTGKDMPGFEALARYVFYTATGQSLEKVGKPAPDGLIGETELFRVHLFYQPDKEWLRSNEAALNAERVAAIEQGNKGGKRAIVFAVAKFMSQKELTARRIEFCQLPYAVHRILGD
ncbi:site-specific DNA-methyltransferase [Larsenimonas rhizosphaerae]|uniref:site-specific DNA-methyltransferase (adenine-specific) n=1 Tax=Larsenimonas rhizosphaerae TaxID=2944682 RepID=A0AA41ZCR9_9GAMM|nr:site-specific DNA-methyltransferase [Larsenimonas rhizosphaerae]MCX2522909.1 site-specific DNA-methyltransferase [Larsenimonas rhizosphaerae]